MIQIMDKRSEKIQSVTLWGAGVNLLLSAFKMCAGIFGNSAAMVADAVHSLSDLVSDFVVVIFARIAGKGKDKDHDYGHGKYETLATLFVSLLLLVVGAKMIASSVSLIVDCLNGGQMKAPSYIALAAALVSIVSKEILYQWTLRVGRGLNSQAMIANAWHHRTDALSSIGALLGIGGAMLLGGKWAVLDPVVCVVISVVIIVVAVKMAAPALSELTDASLPDDVEQRIIGIISSVENVRNVHGLKTRNCGHYCVMEAHLVVDPEMTVAQAHVITDLAEEKLREAFGPEMQISLHVEPFDPKL